jgi:hypothetical protein
MEKYGTDSSELRQGTMAGALEHSNKISGTRKGGQILTNKATTSFSIRTLIHVVTWFATYKFNVKKIINSTHEIDLKRGATVYVFVTCSSSEELRISNN